MTEQQRLLALYGTAESLPAVETLEIDDLSAELVCGQLRTIRFAGVEVLRKIAFLYRDRNWLTPSPQLTLAAMERRAGSIVAGWTGRFVHEGGVFNFNATLTMTPRRLHFAVEGLAGASLLANRIGFVVLHPASAAGGALTIGHVDGELEAGMFPKRISPHQPALSIRTLEHVPAAGISAKVTLEGETFEMEDQRNWTDASFKTYSRPLSAPRPFTIAAGERVMQAVTLDIGGSPRPAPAACVHASTNLRLPEFGIGLGPATRMPAETAMRRLADLAPSHLLCLHHLDADDPLSLEVHGAMARAVPGSALNLEAVLPGIEPSSEVRRLLALANAGGLHPTQLTLHLPAHVAPLEVAKVAKRALPQLAVGIGAYTNFVELNRRSSVAGVDFIAHATSSITHDADDQSVMQTHESLLAVFATARMIAGGAGYRVGPAAIALRRPAAPAPLAATRTPGASSDPRQRGLFAAAWLVGYAAQAAQAGVEAVTLGTLTGPAGAVDDDGSPRPIYSALRILLGASGKPFVRLPFTVDDVRGLAWLEIDGIRALVANQTRRRQRLPISGAVIESVLEAGGGRPTGFSEGQLDLDAYAVAHLRLPN